MKSSFSKIFSFFFCSLCILLIGCDRFTKLMEENETAVFENTQEVSQKSDSFGDLLSEANEENQSEDLSKIQQTSPSPSPQTNLDTSTWEVYDEGLGFEFMYPPELIPEELDFDYIVLLRPSDSDEPNKGISVDSRKADLNAQYDTATSSIESILTDVTKKEIKNGVKISGKISSGYGQGMKIHAAVLHYEEAAIVFKTSDESPYVNYFDQIVNTLEFD